MINGDHSQQSDADRTASPWVTGIVVALPEELSTLTKRKLAQGESVAIADNLLIAYAGAGPENAESAANRLIAQGANRLVSWGCAAALVPELSPGDLVLPRQIISEQQHVYKTDTEWDRHLTHALDQHLSIATGTLAESSRIVASSKNKHAIHDQTGAIVLDMESSAVMKAAQEANLPGLVIRAVADPAGMDLPQAVIQALNAQGQVEIIKLLRHLLTHPSEIPALIRLGLHFHAAQKTLKTVAKHLGEITLFQS